MQRTTLNLDDKLIKELMKDTGIKRKTDMIHHALIALRRRLSAQRLADMAGTMPNLKPVPRRRFE